MARILNIALAALVLLHSTNASMNPLMLSRTAMLTTIRKAGPSSSSTSMSAGTSASYPDTSIDEWYEDGCDELLEASSVYERSNDSDYKNEKEVAMCVSHFTFNYKQCEPLICYVMCAVQVSRENVKKEKHIAGPFYV